MKTPLLYSIGITEKTPPTIAWWGFGNFIPPHSGGLDYFLLHKNGKQYFYIGSSTNRIEPLNTSGDWEAKNGKYYDIYTLKSMGDLGCPELVADLIYYYKMKGTDTLWLREKPFTEGFRYISKYVRIADSLAIIVYP